jgi:hypothetical protein
MAIGGRYLDRPARSAVPPARWWWTHRVHSLPLRLGFLGPHAGVELGQVATPPEQRVRRATSPCLAQDLRLPEVTPPPKPPHAPRRAGTHRT